ASDGDVIGKLVAAFDAVHRGVRFAAEIGVTGDIYPEARATLERGVAEVVTAASELKAEFVECGIAKNGVVLEGGVEIAVLGFPNSRARVLAVDLVLRGGLYARDQRGRNTHTEERSVAIVPALIKTRGPETGLLHFREIAAQGIQAGIR